MLTSLNAIDRSGDFHVAPLAARRLTVLHVITGLEIGGSERMLQKLISVDRSDISHHVVQLRSGGEVADELRDSGVDVTDGSLTVSAAGLRRLALMARLTAKLRPDVIQTWLYHADVVGALLGGALRRPVVWNIRGSDHPGMRRPVVRACVALSRFPEVVIANSEAGRDAHLEIGYRARSWRIIPNGFDTTVFAPSDAARSSLRRELGVPPSARLIGMVARSDPLKNHALFIAAMRKVLEAAPSAYALLVGDGMTGANPMLHAIQADELLRNRIFFLGPRRDVAQVTAALDVACLTSTSEGFPNVIGEAMACGVECVVTDVGGASTIVGDAGIVVQSGDVEAFANGVLLALGRNGSERRVVADRARERIVDRYSLQAVAAAYAALYRSVSRAS
ncbi:MAG: glycosyltransferase [Gemmatimonadaceae bacterium]